MDRIQIIYEMANNHMGDIEHGLRIIEEFSALSKSFDMDFFFKFQFRDLDSFIHPDYKGSELKFVKRFEETYLSDSQWSSLFKAVRENGLGLIVTPFDEISVRRLNEFGVDILKIASCSLGDWPLFEEIGRSWKGPVIASTAGASQLTVDRSVDFLVNRGLELTLMHCVGLYPTPTERLEVGQVKYLAQRYPDLKIGYSTHEDPSDVLAGPIAFALGARTFEKHVGVSTDDYELNKYSASPEQTREWLEALSVAKSALGATDGKREIQADEYDALRQLRRGCYLKRDIGAGASVGQDSLFFAIPVDAHGVTANDLSKYVQFVSKRALKANTALSAEAIVSTEVRPEIELCHDKIVTILRNSGVVVPNQSELEISHHYGLDRFFEVGLGLVTVVNESYCKKLLISLPGQFHPAQFHKKKSETFHVLWGDLNLTLDGESRVLGVGDVVTIPPGVVHEFSSSKGVVIEEISTTHFGSDSFYLDESINANKNRKTTVKIRLN